MGRNKVRNNLEIFNASLRSSFWGHLNGLYLCEVFIYLHLTLYPYLGIYVCLGMLELFTVEMFGLFRVSCRDG